MPMRANKAVQTGPKIQAGGLRAGLVRVAYQVGIDGIVNTEPIIPANSEATMAMINLNVLIVFIY